MANTRPKAAPLPPPPVRAINATGSFGLGPIVSQAKRQGHFDDQALDLAAKYGWEGAPDDVLNASNPADPFNGIRVADAQNFIRKTLHEIHNAACAPHCHRLPQDPSTHGCPDLSHVGTHLGLNAADTAALEASLRAIYDAEVSELAAMDPAKRKALFEANAAEDIESRKRARIAMALQGAE